jgi:pimeloyl-ACP methyl ester carboxylesterase
LYFSIDNNKVFSMDLGENFNEKKHSIILLHGSGQSHVVWSLTAQYFSSENYNVFALDLPGHGYSEGDSLKTIEAMSEWLNKVIVHLNIKQHTLIGHSQGCLIALEYANKYSENLKNIIFVAGSYEIPVNKKLIDLALSGDVESLNLMMKWAYGNSKQFIGGNPLQKILNSSREVREVLAVDLIACNNYKNGINALKKVTCSTFFIFGELDKMIQIKNGKKFAELLNCSNIHIIKNCGHMIILENAFEMREKILEFLKNENNNN